MAPSQPSQFTTKIASLANLIDRSEPHVIAGSAGRWNAHPFRLISICALVDWVDLG